MRKISISGICILIGCCFICYAGYIFVANQRIELDAEKNSAIIVRKIVENIEGRMEEVERGEETNTTDDMVIDDELYCGILSIPKLGITLPIQSQWTYANLQISPCVYQEEPFSIAAHNYQAHFGRLIELETEDEVLYTTVSGGVQVYEVLAVTQIEATETEQLEEDYDMTLFTCDYNDNSRRILVRLKEIK